MAADDPFVVVDDFVADGGGVAVAGVDDGVGGQRGESVRDGFEDGGEVGVGPAGGTWAALEQGVAGEHGAQFGGMPAYRPGGVDRPPPASSNTPWVTMRSIGPPFIVFSLLRELSLGEDDHREQHLCGVDLVEGVF